MKSKLAALFVCLLLLLFPLLAQAEEPIYDPEALTAYAQAWDAYFQRAGFPYRVFIDHLNDGTEFLETDYDSRQASEPGDWDVSLLLFPSDGSLGVIIRGNALDSPLKNVRLYTEDRVFTADYVDESWSEGDPSWLFYLVHDSWRPVIGSKDVTVRFDTGKGLKYHTLFSSLESGSQSAGIDLALCLAADALEYAIPGREGYKSAAYLPDETEGDAASVSGLPAGASSFSSDYHAIEDASQSMFYVEVYDDRDELLATGSGFVAFDDHCFITNHHVIEDAAYLIVYDDKDDDHGYKLTDLIAADKKKDIAILAFPSGSRYPSLPLDTSGKLMRGQPIIVIGSPKGIKNTVSNGIISALSMEDGVLNILFTAAISPGSSGGALFSDDGQVIGLVYAKLKGGENMNYAVDIAEVAALKNEADGKTVSLAAFNGIADDAKAGQSSPQPGCVRLSKTIFRGADTVAFEITNTRKDVTVISYELYLSPKLPVSSWTDADIEKNITSKVFYQLIAPLGTVVSPDIAVDCSPFYIAVKQVRLADGTVLTYDLKSTDYSCLVLPGSTSRQTATPKPTATPTVRPTATPKPTATPTVRPTATPRPTAKPTERPAKAQYFQFPSVQGEYNTINNHQISMRIFMKNISSTATVTEYTLWYGTADPATPAGAAALKTKTVAQTYPPGIEKYSGYFTVDTSSASYVYVAIKQVRLSDGTVVSYDIDEAVFSPWRLNK